jgi:hypothetical protein
MNTAKKIALIGAICITVVYEIILFTIVIKGAYDQSMSLFFTYLFSLAGAVPIAIIFIMFARPSQAKEVGSDSK